MAHTPTTRQREMQKRRMRRARWLQENGPCRRCGSRDHLEVHHIDPKRKIDHKVWSWSELRRSAELRKCEPLCRTCHHGPVHHPMIHGKSGYDRGCRCAACKAAQIERVYKWRLSKWGTTSSKPKMVVAGPGNDPDNAVAYETPLAPAYPQ